MTEAPKRSRTYDWIGVEFVGPPLIGRTGLQYYEGLRDGAIPAQPIAATIGWSVLKVEPGMVRLSIRAGDHLFHGGGMLHGGVLATLLDSAMAGAVMSTLPEGARCATLDGNVQYLKAVRTENILLFAQGKMTHSNGRIAAAEARVEDEQGRVYAQGTSTLLVTKPKEA